MARRDVWPPGHMARGPYCSVREGTLHSSLCCMACFTFTILTNVVLLKVGFAFESPRVREIS